MEGGSPTIVTNSEGGRTTPSVVAYTKSGDRLVGQVSAALRVSHDPTLSLLSTFSRPCCGRHGAHVTTSPRA